MGGFVGEERRLTSCLLSIAQLLGKICQHRLSKETNRINVHLVVITRAQINHDMLVSVGAQQVGSPSKSKESERDTPVEKHHRARIVQLVHLPSDAAAHQHLTGVHPSSDAPC